MSECSSCGAADALFRVKNPDKSYANERLCRACRERAIKLIANPPCKAKKTGMTTKQLMAMLSFPFRRKKALANVIPPTPVPGMATVVANPEVPGSKAKYHRHRQIPPTCFQGTADKFKTVDIRHTTYPRGGRYFKKGVKAIVGRLKRTCVDKFGKPGKRVKFHKWATQSILTPRKLHMKPTAGEKRLEKNPEGAPVGIYFAKIKKWPKMVTGGVVEGIRETQQAVGGVMHRNPPRPITRYSITYFDPETDEGDEKSWTFDSMEEATKWKKHLSEVWETPEDEIKIETVKHGEKNPVPGVVPLGSRFLSKGEMAYSVIRELFFHPEYKGRIPEKDYKEIIDPKKAYAKLIGPKRLHQAWHELKDDGYIRKEGDVWIWGLPGTDPARIIDNPKGEQFVKLSTKGQDVKSSDGKHDGHVRLEDGEIAVDIFDTTVDDPDEAHVTSDSFSNSTIGRNQAKDFLREYGIRVKFVEKPSKNPPDSLQERSTMFEKERREHPKFTNEQVQQIVEDHMAEHNPCPHDWETLDLNFRRCRKCSVEERRKSPDDKWIEVTHDPVYGTEYMPGDTVPYAITSRNGR